MIAAITTAVSVFIFGAFALHQAWADKGGKPVEQHAPDWQGRAIFSLAERADLLVDRDRWRSKAKGRGRNTVLWMAAALVAGILVAQ